MTLVVKMRFYPIWLPTLINGKVESVPWFKTWFELFGFVFGKMKVLECSFLRKWDFSLYDYMFDKYEGWVCGPWCETWYLYLFGSKFGTYKVLGWP